MNRVKSILLAMGMGLLVSVTVEAQGSDEWQDVGIDTPARRSVFRYVELKAKLQLCNKTKFCKQKNEIL